MTILDILNWIKNYKINTHAIASLLAALPILYTQNTQFHDAVTATWAHVPNALRGLIVAAVPVWTLYRNSQKSAAAPPVPAIDGNAATAAAEQARKPRLGGFGEN